MTSGGNNFDGFPEIVTTREIATKIEKTFLLLLRGREPISRMGLMLQHQYSTHLNPALELARNRMVMRSICPRSRAAVLHNHNPGSDAVSVNDPLYSNRLEVWSRGLDGTSLTVSSD